MIKFTLDIDAWSEVFKMLRAPISYAFHRLLLDVMDLAGDDERFQHAVGFCFVDKAFQFTFGNLFGHIEVAGILSLALYLHPFEVVQRLLTQAVCYGELLLLETVVG